MPDEATLLALKPYAETGNIEAMQAMVSGCGSLHDRGKNSWGPWNACPVDRYTPLAGLWAVKLVQRVAVPDKKIGSCHITRYTRAWRKRDSG